MLVFALSGLAAGSGGCALTGREGDGSGDVPMTGPLQSPVALVRATDAGFDDRVRVTAGEGGEAVEPRRPVSAGFTPSEVEPGFPDEVWIGPVRPTGPVGQPGDGAFVQGGRVVKEREDTDLGRSRAQRRGEGGGRTLSEEEEDAEAGEEFKSDLLVRAFGLEDTPYNVFGWLQGSFTGNPARPRNGENFGVNPNTLAKPSRSPTSG
ncbi:MAG: hypothetical protein LC745_00915 [Planctomycetia bacterium]|nr:hypothetical protein [Planctomycetia bacterium]